MIQSETLTLLEWPRLCQHLATFASTKLGMVAAENLKPSDSQEESRKLIAQTQEVYELELRLLQGLSFEGIEDFGDSLARAELGGVLTGEELLALATTLAAMRRLRRLIDDQPEEIPNLKALVTQLRTYPEFEQEIHRCIDERGQVSDRASVKLGEIRGRLKALRGQIYQKLQNIMQRQGSALQ
ncbi:MAG: endonuclease MutS2, partial [Spirulinaceae cyanobacterium]